ncbi:MAG: hypothetical protein QM779_01165 [Propionicimonas sp.]|uniref:hypothetical protein n=1 Tax=Propionicimonas sp. TaxID=1955623 RepID=UPI003D0CEEE6
MQHLRSRLLCPGLRTRLAAAVLTILGLLPVLQHLPKVSVVACFEAGHPLYQLVATTEFVGGSHCVSAPTTVVSWTLMVGASLVVQLALLPLLLTVGTLLLRAAGRLAASADRVLAAALVRLAALLVPAQQPLPAYVRTPYRGSGRTRANPRRGPPACL